MNFNTICSPAYKLQLEVWKSHKGSWFARAWADEMCPDTDYTAHASTPQEAVDLVIKYWEAGQE